MILICLSIFIVIFDFQKFLYNLKLNTKKNTKININKTFKNYFDLLLSFYKHIFILILINLIFIYNAFFYITSLCKKCKIIKKIN